MECTNCEWYLNYETCDYDGFCFLQFQEESKTHWCTGYEKDKLCLAL